VLGAAMLGGRGAPALPLDAEAAGGAAGRGAAALKGEGGAAALLMLPDAEDEAPGEMKEGMRLAMRWRCRRGGRTRGCSRAAVTCRGARGRVRRADAPREGNGAARSVGCRYSDSRLSAGGWGADSAGAELECVWCGPGPSQRLRGK
jgi:hypothetical protein